jgi:hypothetical protein
MKRWHWVNKVWGLEVLDWVLTICSKGLLEVLVLGLCMVYVILVNLRKKGSKRINSKYINLVQNLC